MVADPNGKQAFRTNYNIYISFYSENGMDIAIQTKFIDVNEFRKKNMLSKVDNFTPHIDEALAEQMSLELRMGYESRRASY